MPSLAQPRFFAVRSGSPFTLPGRGRIARSCGSAPRSRRPALLLLTLVFLALAAGASPARADTVAHTLRWASSPRKGPTGQPLPPAVTYEVWLSEDGKPETLAASVADTCWTFPAAAGCVYVARVRGVSAQGLKSAFSPASDPWRAALARSPPWTTRPSWGRPAPTRSTPGRRSPISCRRATAPRGRRRSACSTCGAIACAPWRPTPRRVRTRPSGTDSTAAGAAWQPAPTWSGSRAGRRGRPCG